MSAQPAAHAPGWPRTAAQPGGVDGRFFRVEHLLVFCHQTGDSPDRNLHSHLRQESVNLPMLAAWPLITYDPTFTGRTKIDHAFQRAGVAPNIVLTAVDSDVIKTYVELGLGIGIIAEMAFDPVRDAALAAMPAGHLFATNTTRLGIRAGNWLRRFDYDFIELFAPLLSRSVVMATLRGGGDDPGL